MALPIAAGLAVAGAAKKFLSRTKRPDIRRAIAELRATRPVGYLTPEDLRAASLTRGRLTEGINAGAEETGYEIGRRFRSRGLAGSGAEERERARLEQDRLLGLEHAGETSEEQLYNIRTGREGFERQKALDIFGAQVGDTAREQARQQAETGAFWNSLNEFIPTIVGALAPKTAAPAPGPTSGVGPPVPGPTPGGGTRIGGGYLPEQRPGVY